jgi:hypothetical protein
VIAWLATPFFHPATAPPTNAATTSPIFYDAKLTMVLKKADEPKIRDG